MGGIASALAGPASSILGGALGFLGAGRAGNAINNTAIAAEHGILGASANGQQYVTGALNQNSGAVNQAALSAAGNVSQYGNYALNALSPYSTAGGAGAQALQQYALNAPKFNFQPTMAQLQATPGYQFEQQAGLNAIQGQNAAQGLGNSSNQNYDAAKYATGLASEYYQNAFQNAQQQFQTNQNATLANLGALTNTGLSVAGLGNQDIYNTGIYGGNALQNAAALNAQQNLQGNEFNAQLGLNAANQAGNFALEGAGAHAAGILGQYNSLAGGIGGALAPPIASNPYLQYGYGSPVGASPMGDVNMTNVNAGVFG